VTARILTTSVSILCALAAGPSRAADKSSTRPNVISVPKGPGSIEGLGESFEASLNSGSVRETVKVELPPGTNGLTPSLALTYDSGQGNGSVGIGWSLGLSTIQVQTEKGLPRAYDGSERFLLDGAEIVPLGDDVYRMKNEGRFIRIRRGGDHWEVDLPDGKTLRYGVSSNARVESAAGVAIFSWALEDAVDRFRNRIAYTYAKDADGQPRLVAIDYNLRPGAAENHVDLEYEPRPDPIQDGRPGFLVKTTQRLRVISAHARGQLVRRYRFDYQETNDQNGLSLLSAVTEYGSDGATALPPVRFWYSAFEPEKARPVAMQQIPQSSIPSLEQDGNGELVDIDGDGFPDLLHAETGRHWYYLNEGGLRFGPRVDMPWSPAVALSTSGVEIADLDGDGLPDLVAKSGGTAFRYFPNHGDGQWQPSRAFTNNPSFGFEDANVRMGDFDGDKLVDAIQATSSGFYLWRNHGDGSWDAPLTASLPSGLPGTGFADSKLRLADMNGDRLLDLVYVLVESGGYASVTCWPSLGWGRFDRPVSAAGGLQIHAARDSDLYLADVNGDGIADLVYVDTDHVDVWPFLPSGSYGPPTSIATPHRGSGTAIRFADMNGNGSTDIVWSTPSEQRLEYLDLMGELRPNLLVAVENGLGKSVTFRYGSSGAEYQEAREAGQPWATRVPFPVQVLTESIVSDGLGHRHVAGYRYRDGWYAGDTREFRGFRVVTRTEVGDANEATAVQIHEFDLGQSAECRKGSLLSLEQRTETGTLPLLRDRYELSVRTYATGTDGREVAFSERRVHEAEHWEGGDAPVTTRENWEYDDFGNVTDHWEWGIVQGEDLLSGHDERITTTTYAKPDEDDRWFLGRATSTTVTDGAGAVVSQTRTYYDGEPFVGLPFGQLGAAGVPTRSESWVAGDHWAQTERVQRDEYGLVTATLDPLGARREIDHDPETHSFPVAERAFYGDRVLTFAAEYDLFQGLLTRYRDPAGNETAFQWDTLHRLTGIVRPGDTAELPTLSFEYVYSNPRSYVRSLNRLLSGKGEVIEKRLWYDGLGRELATVEQAEGGRTVANGQKEFGALGRVVREYEPQFTDGYDLAEPSAKYTAHAYDALGREVRTVLPDGSVTERRYAPLSVEYWDAEDLDPASPHVNTPRTEKLNALGVAQVEERLGQRSLVTRFDRDAKGRIASVTDAVENVSTWRLDGLGRTVEVNHPDAGITTFDFDDAGNLRQRTDARGAYVATDYDPLGRPTLERLGGSSGEEEEKVVYHYDDPSPLFPGDVAIGELSWVEDGSGEQHFKRDERSRLVESIRKVDGKSYRIARVYDDLDRQTRLTYPDGRVLDFGYNPRGLLETVPGIISGVTYDARGLFTRREHSNGAASAAGYDDLHRMVALETSASGGRVQQLGYAYDRAGNLLRIDDALHQGGPLAAGRSLGYDDLYRLVSAAGGDCSWKYAFNDVGDFTNKSDVGDYVLGKGHQVASAGGKPYRHDEAGNVIERPGSKQVFDAKGRVKAVTLEDGTVVSYRNDYIGARVVKESSGPRGNHRTVYADKVSEERDAQVVNYVLSGSTRLARLGGESPRPIAAGTLALLLRSLTALALALFVAAGLLGFTRTLRARARSLAVLASACGLLAFTTASCGHGPEGIAPIPATHYHADHLGGTALLTNPDGSVAAEVTHDPWGVQIAGSTEPYAFTGKEYEADTGLYDFAARVYDPVIGRFLSPDPAAVTDPQIGVPDPQRLSSYVYARGSPTTYVDRDGRCATAANGELDCMATPNAWTAQSDSATAQAWRAGSYASATLNAANSVAARVTQVLGFALQVFADTTVNPAVHMVNAYHSGDARQIQDAHFRVATLLYGGMLAREGAALYGGLARSAERDSLLLGSGEHLTAGGIPQTLGRGSTANLSKGTTLARNLREQLAIEQAMASPGAGTKLRLQMTDPRWPGSEGWVKMQQVIESGGRERPINVHYLSNQTTGAIDDFKIVLPGPR
jgi:RHS repeat-associated protein